LVYDTPAATAYAAELLGSMYVAHIGYEDELVIVRLHTPLDGRNGSRV
jgi:hypothetical protein